MRSIIGYISVILLAVAGMAPMPGHAAPKRPSAKARAVAASASSAAGRPAAPADTLPAATAPSPADSLPAAPAAPRIRGSVTPVEIDTEKPPGPVWHKYDIHGNQLETPVLFLADTDTVKTPSARSPWPAYCGVDLAANFLDAPLMLAGQQYGAYDMRASVSLFNWVFPTVEVGLGYARPLGDVTYTPRTAMYYRLGFDYNFLYKSTPDYKVYAGFRAAYTPWRYNLRAGEYTSSSSSSADTADTADTPHKSVVIQQRADMYYGQVLFGIKVKVYRRLYMGWDIRYSFPLKMTDFEPSTDWYIPGYGGSTISGSFFAGIHI